jgi:hypothetical protein
VNLSMGKINPKAARWLIERIDELLAQAGWKKLDDGEWHEGVSVVVPQNIIEKIKTHSVYRKDL